jgi:hypothetical protein
MGYGARALQCLNAFYSGEYFNLDEATEAEQSYPDPSRVDEVKPFAHCALLETHVHNFSVRFFAHGQADCTSSQRDAAAPSAAQRTQA